MTMSAGSTVPTGNTYDKYAASNPLERRMMQRFLQALDQLADECTPTRVLEIGVGEGVVSDRLRRRFPSATIIGVDLPDAELAAEWHARELSCLFGDATSLPFPDGAFDLVVAIEVLEHVARPELALAELQRVCAGTLIASVPFEPIWRAGNIARWRYVRHAGNTPGHVNHWSRWGFRRFVSQRFDVGRVISPLPWTLVLAQARSTVAPVRVESDDRGSR
jgi:SAM-dependent methyltransferase